MTDKSMIVAPKMLVLDEFHRVNNQLIRNTALIHEVRSIEGVPNKTYLVDDNKVFVFARLIELVKEHAGLDDLVGEPRKQAIRDLVPSAWVSPHEAVTKWEIMPESYALVEDENGFTIRHTPFNAVIPRHFPNHTQAQEAALNDALALLLVGGVIEGTQKADFTYRGQPLKLLAGFDVAGLPPRPDFEVDHLLALPGHDKNVDSIFGFLSLHERFIEGFSPLSRDMIERISSLNATWQRTTEIVQQLLAEKTDVWPVWSLVDKFSLSQFNSVDTTVPSWVEPDVLAELRNCYPELSVLHDAELYRRYESFFADVLDSRCSVIAYRDDDFLYHLLGSLVNHRDADTLPASDIASVGRIIAGVSEKSVDEALALGMAWYRYDQALESMCYRASVAMQFLKSEQTRTGLSGSTVRSLMDPLLESRKFGCAVVTGKQSLSDFPALGEGIASPPYGIDLARSIGFHSVEHTQNLSDFASGKTTVIQAISPFPKPIRGGPTSFED